MFKYLYKRGQSIYAMTSLDISNQRLISLRGIKFPPNLEMLYCSYNQLTSLEGCPQGLKRLYCSGNQITSLEGLPQGLEEFICSSNRITSLEGLPQSLRMLSCRCNQLTSLKGCPEGLIILNCPGNQITSLKGCPQGLKYLDCARNKITSLEGLHQGLTNLRCNNNQITSFTSLPTSVAKFVSFHNPLEPMWKDKRRTEIHAINYCRCLNRLKRLIASVRIQRFWKRYWYDTLDKDGYSRYAKYVFRQESYLVR